MVKIVILYIGILNQKGDFLIMEKTFIFGHKNPDTDAITSSIVMANLETKLGNNVEALALGKPNKETEYVLNYFGVEAPRVINENEIPDGSNVILVDHNNPEESISNLDNVNILDVDNAIIDAFLQRYKI